MKKLLSLSAACGVMLMFASGSVLAQDHDRGDHGRDRGQHEQRRDHRDQAHHDNRYSHDRDNRHDNRGHKQAHYATWHDRGRHEGWYHRGGYLPVEYRTGYVVTDWRRDRLRAPPRGYHWVRSNSGDFLLVAVATGIIADLILNH